MKKLSTEDKIAIIHSEESSRTLGDKYDCHHSSIANVRKESYELLEKYWNKKSENVGRPRDDSFENTYLIENRNLKKELEELRIAMKLQKDFLDLRLKLEKEKDSLKKK